MAEATFPVRKEFGLFVKLLQLEFSSGTRRVRRICELYDYMVLTDRSRYLNFGYWAADCESYDDACEAMVDLLGEAAELGTGDHVLDAGFGYGDQDFRWLETTGVARIVGINITPLQIREARRQARLKGVEERVEFLEMSATDLAFEPGTFDKVISLESPIQFEPREAFLEHAYRVLRPGGRFAAVEILPLDAADGGSPSGARRKWKSDRWFGATPIENWVPAQEYCQTLQRLGFTDVKARSIRDDVYEPWSRYMRSRIDDPAFRARLSRLVYRPFRKGLLDDVGGRVAGQSMAQTDYIVVSAMKPPASGDGVN
ncbi:MAG TPA: methyltransferase domain-containing protein [Streptosporangiaceae bacterium]|nr:methyltransferase domain-containing protein [Streptosporangiaceae bacterium]